MFSICVEVILGGITTRSNNLRFLYIRRGDSLKEMLSMHDTERVLSLYIEMIFKIILLKAWMFYSTVPIFGDSGIFHKVYEILYNF